MSTPAEPSRRRARINKLPLSIWEDPWLRLPQLDRVDRETLTADDETAEIELLGITRDGNWYVARHRGDLGWLSTAMVELPEPSLAVPQGLDKVGLCANQALTASGELQRRRQRQARAWLGRLLDDGLLAAFRAHPEVAAQLEELERQVEAQRTSAPRAARRLLEAFRRE